MKRHVIVGRLGAGDRSPVPAASDEQASNFQLISADRRFDGGIGHAFDHLIAIGVYPSELGLDLLILAAHVYAADTRISRRSESQDNWTREMRIVVPVRDPGIWNRARPTLRDMLNFLTGDRWIIDFRDRPKKFERAVAAKPRTLVDPPFDCVSLFSGGLDSLIGAIDLLEKGKTPLFVSHAAEGAVSDAQNGLFTGLKRRYPRRAFERFRLWMNITKNLVRGVGSEDSTRARSFLFIAAAAFAASGLPGPSTLYVPENGFIALNVPLDPLRLGSLSTRTTHPFYLARWRDLLTTLDLPFEIVNPFWSRTKGEMVADCANKAVLAELITTSLSCSSPTKGRWKGFGVGHCGYCLPCLIRRASLKKGLGRKADPTQYLDGDLTTHVLSTTQAEGQQARSFQFAIERLRSNPKLSKLLIHKPGSLRDVSPADQLKLAGVYERGLDEVAALLANVTTSPT
jgi:hypothetical protein